MAAVVYIVILAMWAAVLVPMWARHRDQSRSLRTVDHFRRALTTLSDDPKMHEMLPVSPAMGRRRKVYAALTGLFVVACLLWIARLASASVMLAPLSLMVAFTVAARKQVRRERRERDIAIRYLRARARCMAAHPSRAEQVARPLVKAAGAPPVAARPAVRVDDGVDVAARAADVAQPWSAQPLTLPTYVTAPTATPVRRNLDVASDGVFDREQMLRQAGDVRRARAAEVERDFIDDFLEQTHGQPADDVFDQQAPDRRRVANG